MAYISGHSLYQNEPRIRVFITGGTFDKEYDELTGRLYFRESHLPEMLTLGRSTVDLVVTTLFMIDSLEMTAAQREHIVSQCREVEETHIVITHGTDTMAETARQLAADVPGKTIVLTGAMVPYKFGSSDGMFNLGSALAFAQTLAAGVYVAMNGRCFPAERVEKNRATGLFDLRR
jgi:L-asparaginase